MEAVTLADIIADKTGDLDGVDSTSFYGNNSAILAKDGANLTNSYFEGIINGGNTAKEISLVLDSTSKIKLTGDCYVTSFENADNTNSNIVYVNGKAI